MILEKQKIVFVHAPRTSGTSIEKSITNDKVPDFIKHLKASQYKKMIGPDWNSYYKFTIVRNPWDRIVSMYHQNYFSNIGIKTNKTLKYFLNNYRPAPWEHGVQCSDYADEDMNLVIKYENRVDGLQQFFKDTGIIIDNNIKERSDNKREFSDYKHFYDDETTSIVYNMFLDDIKKYDYIF